MNRFELMKQQLKDMVDDMNEGDLYNFLQLMIDNRTPLFFKCEECVDRYGFCPVDTCIDEALNDLECRARFAHYCKEEVSQ